MPTPRSVSISVKHQYGATIIENTVAILVFLLLLLAAFESAHWLVLRQALNTVLLDTARIAATQQAHPQIIEEAFVHHINKLPAFSFALTKAPQVDSSRWHIEKIRLQKPPPDSQSDIQHSYQALQYQQGNTQVFEDNTLHLRLHYLHRPITPIIRALVNHQLTIVTDVKVAMQSDQSAATRSAALPPAPSWKATPSLSPLQPNAPTPSSVTPAAWQPTVPPTAWQPPQNKNPPPWEGCDEAFCCAPRS